MVKWKSVPAFLFRPRPPRRQRLDDDITCFVGTAKGHIPLPRVFVDNPTRDIFFLAPQVMITGFVITTGGPPARERATIDRGFTVHAHAFDLLHVLDRVVFFLIWSKMASVSVIFFCGLALSTLRKR